MEGAGIPDIRPLIVNDQRYVRINLVCGLLVIVLAASLAVIWICFSFYFAPSFKTAGEHIDFFIKMGGVLVSFLGAIVSFLTLFPIKEFFFRLERLRILRAMEARMRMQTVPEEWMTDNLLKMYGKALTG